MAIRGSEISVQYVAPKVRLAGVIRRRAPESDGSSKSNSMPPLITDLLEDCYQAKGNGNEKVGSLAAFSYSAKIDTFNLIKGTEDCDYRQTVSCACNSAAMGHPLARAVGFGVISGGDSTLR